jgi:TolB-like protein/Tfp pilus assembly protein PilF
MGLTDGGKLGAYEILSRIGAGGMGEVYRARDLRLDRTVALKILPPEQAGDRDRAARFLQEARAASALNHPNVAHIYEIGEAEGLQFIAMEFVDGETVAARIGGRPLPIGEIIDIAAQAAGALAEAHSKRIVHRDIKPANIMITPRAQVKVLDFGLAKIDSGAQAETVTAITQPGMVMGTVPYMSPEQVMGRTVDARSDIFSLGAVIYEMATGRLPFAGKTVAEMMHSVSQSQPEAVARFNYDAPPELERVIRKCLEKDPERRYQSARELEVDLLNLKRDSQAHVTAPPRRAARIWVAAAGVAILLLATAFYFLRARGTIDSLAVLPFANASNNAELEYLSDGLTEQLINGLTQFPGLKVMARTTAFTYKGKQVDPKQVGSDLHVRAVLTGRVAQRGDNLVVQADLVDASDGAELWGRQYNGKAADIQSVQEEITRQVAERLRAKSSNVEGARPDRRSVQNPEAYRLYLQGRYAMSEPSEDHIRTAVDYYQQALAKDPKDALALAGMADAFSYLGDMGTTPPREVMGQAKAAAQKALAIDDSVAEAHASLGIVALLFEWDWPAAEKEFRRALELNPGNAYDRHWYAHYLDARGRFDEAMAEMNKAIGLDPLSEMFNVDYGFQLVLQNEQDRALAQFHRVQQINPNNPFAQYGVAYSLERSGKRQEALAALAKLNVASMPFLRASMAPVYARLGSIDEARKIAVQVTESSKTTYVAALDLAMVTFALGEKDRGFSYLQRAYEERSSGFTFLMRDAAFDSARDDPRFAGLMNKVGLPRAAWAK